MLDCLRNSLPRILSLLIGVAVSGHGQAQKASDDDHLRHALAEPITALVALTDPSNSDFGNWTKIRKEADEIVAYLDAHTGNSDSSPDFKADFKIAHVLAARLQAKDQHFDSQVITIGELADLVGVDCCERPPPKLRFRKRATRILAAPRLDEAKLKAKYDVNRLRLEKTNPKDVEPDLGGMIDLRSDHTPEFKVLAGDDPMLTLEDLASVSYRGNIEDWWQGPNAPFETYVSGYRLVPAYDLRSGYEIAREALKVAQSGVLFSCSPDEDEAEKCFFLVTSGRQEFAPHQVSLCSVVGEVEVEPPVQCWPFIIVTSQQVWVAVVDRIWRNSTGTSGGAVSPPEPEATWIVYSNRADYSFREVFARALASPPLNLQVHITSHSVRASSPQRYSDVLSSKYDPWHEWLSLVVEEDLYPAPDKAKLRAAGMWASTNLLVNKQGDDNLESWHPASGALLARLRAQLYVNILNELKKVCTVRDVLGNRITCYFKPAVTSE